MDTHFTDARGCSLLTWYTYFITFVDPALRQTTPPAGLVRHKTHNLYRKAVHAGKWQNFTAGIGTGAAYVSLHGLHWHPHWITVIEYVHGEQSQQHLYICISHRLVLFFINVGIFSINLILLTINTLCASPPPLCYGSISIALDLHIDNPRVHNSLPASSDHRSSSSYFFSGPSGSSRRIVPSQGEVAEGVTLFI